MADKELESQLEGLSSNQEDPIKAMELSELTSVVEKKRQQDQLRSKAQLHEKKQLTICFLT